MEAAKAEEESAPPTTRVKRALEIDEQEATPREEVPVKRARVDELEREVWVDGRRGRALLGLAIGLGARYVPLTCHFFRYFVNISTQCYITLLGLEDSFFFVISFLSVCFWSVKLSENEYIYVICFIITTVDKICFASLLYFSFIRYENCNKLECNRKVIPPLYPSP